MADCGLSTDALVSWKPRDHVRKALLRQAGAAVSAGNLNTLVWRLRAALADAGLPPQLVQTHRLKGLRFALRRPAPPRRSEASGERTTDDGRGSDRHTSLQRERFPNG